MQNININKQIKANPGRYDKPSHIAEVIVKEDRQQHKQEVCDLA
jgi:hypothetical protein